MQRILSIWNGMLAVAANVLYWRRSEILPLKLIRSTTIETTSNVHTKHQNRFFANTLLVADADFSTIFS